MDATALKNRIIERIGKEFGELITEQEMIELVDEALKRAFFEERVVDKGGYNGKTTEPPWLVELAKNDYEVAIKEHVRKWFTENVHIVEEEMKKYLQQGFSRCVIGALDQVFHNSMMNFQQDMETNMKTMFEQRLLNGSW
jgi:hypothetical protein